MFKLKVYKYDSTQEANGYRGQDFSSKVLQGQEIGEDITQILDTAEITLCGLPFKEKFAPETKFIVDLVELNFTLGTETILSTAHFCVDRDTPEQSIISDGDYFDHHISFIEPSVIAQKRLVDNISATYKLKDVTLEELSAYPDTKVNLNIESSKFVPERNFGITTIEHKNPDFTETYQVTGKYFELEGDLSIENMQGQRYSNIYNNIENFKVDEDEYRANFIIPKLAIMYGVWNSKNFTKLGYASITCKIEEFTLNDELNPTNSWSETFISNSNLGEGTWQPLNGFQDRVQGEWLLEQVTDYKYPATSVEGIRCYFKKYTETNASEPSYVISNVPIRTDRKYVVTISLYQFPDNFPKIQYRDEWYKFTGSQPAYWVQNYHYYQFVAGIGTFDIINFDTPSRIELTARKTSGSGSFVTYSVDTGTIVFASATPYSAMALLQKAIINSSIYEKEDGVYIADVNNSKLPFYIDDVYVDRLSATLIIENFYNQKNLWEIMVEVGNYIHAIPELKFGSDDRFIITFNELGRTDEKENKGNKVSIFNSRSVEDYISATSSYITNMVQLGGYVEEWVVPKTTNEQLLVYNDTAEIILSKPIIELLSIQARRNSDGLVRDITDYIYEENVYKTLSIQYDVLPNRGVAMYYSLGDNVITGGQYQLPQANTNIYSDYAFKKILYSAFNGYPTISPAPSGGYWTSLDVSDYTFFVRYRTKDSVRQNHIRPDIRKYLMNSKYDRYPAHNQFNNQTDVVVDSIKFGNNMFGKLIKTGNNSYEVWEWHDNYADVKHKGELYRLNDELYYVAKAKHYVYSSYILSHINFSMDYNELSEIIGIPSEPRFYEISEQSLIWREVAIDDLLLLTDDPNKLEYQANYLFTYDHLADLVLGEGTDFAKYAITVYKGDKDANQYDQTVGSPDFYLEVINAINAYSSENTLTYEWDMVDNYSAGDKIIPTEKVGIDTSAYKSLRAVQYTDVYGRSALMDFYILGDIGTPTVDEIRNFPESPISTKQGEERPFVGNYNILATNVKKYDTNFNGRGIGLLKDCREALSINYNLQLATTSDTFVLSPYVFLPKKENLKIVLLAEEINKLSTGYIDNATIITPIDKQGNTMSSPYFDFSVEKNKQTNEWGQEIVSSFDIDLATIFENVNDGHFTGADGFQRVKGIAILCDVSLDAGLDTEVSTLPYKTQFVVARNIPEFWTREKALSKIYFGAPKKDLVFTNKQ